MPVTPPRPPAFRGVAVSPRQMAEFTNAVQALAERQRLGIPVVFKDNARNHYETDPRFGISAGAGAFTEFPKEAGIAAAALGLGSMAPVEALTAVMGAEWRAIGLRGMYGYSADLATEPRWYRVHETFTEDADLDARIMRALVDGPAGRAGESVDVGRAHHQAFSRRRTAGAGAGPALLVRQAPGLPGRPLRRSHEAVHRRHRRRRVVGDAVLRRPGERDAPGRAVRGDRVRVLARDRHRPAAHAARLHGLRQLRHRHHQRPRLGPRAADDPGARRRRHQRRHRRAVRVQHERHHHRPRQGRSRVAGPRRRGRRAPAHRTVPARAVRGSLRRRREGGAT